MYLWKVKAELTQDVLRLKPLELWKVEFNVAEKMLETSGWVEGKFLKVRSIVGNFHVESKFVD